MVQSQIQVAQLTKTRLKKEIQIWKGASSFDTTGNLQEPKETSACDWLVDDSTAG